MDKEEFYSELQKHLKEVSIEIAKEKADKMYCYMEMIREWNEKINLTAITEPKEMVIKHFVDSLVIEKEIPLNSRVIDVGTGAGFPGIVLKILREDIEITLIDSLNKRVLFLNEVIEKLKLEKIEAIHVRAEDLANDEKHREKFDIAVSRAVANMSTLLEYLLPFVKINGVVLCMKGNQFEEELKGSSKAMKVLGGQLIEVREYCLPLTDMGRTLVIVKKENQTPKQYPRKQGKPAKEPIN